ncbi:MAG: N-acetyltransferase [Phascolarctobacterium sp.]|nr:N-acetyltransferase [Candidatus Phascolarctobacterium caballi]
MQNYLIRQEQKKDYRVVEELVRDAFWNVYRPGCQEHYVLHCFRGAKDYVPELALVMEVGGKIIGQIMFVRAELELEDGKTLPIMTFGPISIATQYKRQGYGLALLNFALTKAKEMGVGAVAMAGNIDFYGKAGFVPAKNLGIHYADDWDADYFLAKELQTGFLDGVKGVYHDPKGYFVCVNDTDGFAKYEASFPYKEKLKLPGQLFGE